MPLARIDLSNGKSPAQRKAAGEVVYRAMVEILKAPENDKFQVIAEHERSNFNIAESYLGITHGQDIAIIQITLNEGRSIEQKKAFYQRVADNLHAELGVRREDVIINLVEVAKENWSFGNGLAPYAG